MVIINSNPLEYMDKVLLVGPSKSLLNNKLGKVIDTFDVECRMNAGGSPDIFNVLNDNKIRFIDDVSPKLLKHENKKYHQPSEWK